ncbi:hypothetical protein NECAME_19422, partial [Necator americanus]
MNALEQWPWVQRGGASHRDYKKRGKVDEFVNNFRRRLSDMTTTGKRVLITGASSGIGLSLVEQLANAGHEVTITVRDAEKASFTREFLAEKQ